jgi:hypothetical protein
MDIAAGDSATVILPMKLDAGVPAFTVFTNTAMVSSPVISVPVSASVQITAAQQLYFPQAFRNTVTQTIATAMP